MTSLAGRAPKDTYKDLLQVPNSNSGVDGTLRAIEDGESTATVLQVSTAAVNIAASDAFQLNGTTLTSSSLLRHEVGGLEADISGISDGDFIVGTGSGTVGLENGGAIRNRITEWLVKSSSYTANAGEAILADTSGAAFTITLPASPSTGDEVWFADDQRTWGTNNLTVDGNGNNILGTSTFTADVDDWPFSLVYNGAQWVFGGRV